ncbi:hypothetical protein P280DRAFT_532918 [Massarina eburnea CBS 473.64]|uniref:Ecp2 effector protein domain-containing protein n=1 Tax=Massarina eburnea CBS 473.64 TaxID=1395130 RepID=A0A6A6RN63_9PLEO|nr:hypothetical protein P280DRAFT_532918 [Massarina eburnea CBS 473.64]
MNFLKALFLSASLATALPASPVSPPTTPSSTLAKRISEESNCGLDMYQSIGQGATLRGLRTLQRIDGYDVRDGNFQDVIWGVPGKCMMIWCGGKVGVYFCVDKTSDGRKIPYDPVDLGRNLDRTYRDCYGGPPSSREKDVIRAFQYWGQGYNLLVQGNADCKFRNDITGDS